MNTWSKGKNTPWVSDKRSKKYLSGWGEIFEIIKLKIAVDKSWAVFTPARHNKLVSFI